LVLVCAPELAVGLSGILHRIGDVVLNMIKLVALLAHNVRHVPEELVELADALLNVPDLVLALNDERLLEVDLVLVRKAQLFLILCFSLLLLLLLSPTTLSIPCSFTGCGPLKFMPSARRRFPLLLKGLSLDALEFSPRSLEFS
jgi:hypothetical protein